MITETRLQELIDQKATIYEVKHNKVKSIELKGKVEIGYKSQYIVVYPSTKFLIRCYCNRLFETEEEANWNLEFGNITRTERLELPSWEKVHKQDKTGISFKSKNGYKIGMLIYKDYDSKYVINVSGEDFRVYCAELTKENYYEACRKCKELFLKGE